MTTPEGEDAWRVETIKTTKTHRVVKEGTRTVALCGKEADAALIVKLHNERPGLERIASLAEELDEWLHRAEWSGSRNLVARLVEWQLELDAAKGREASPR